MAINMNYSTNTTRVRFSKISGLSLVETLLYVALLVILLVVIVNVLLIVMKSYRQISAAKSVQTAAVTSLGRLGQEIRRAKTIASIIPTSSLILNTTDSSGNDETVEFRLDNDGRLYLYEAGGNLGALTPSDATISSLLFQSITAGSNSAVRITETIQSGVGDAERTETFHSTVELRQ